MPPSQEQELDRAKTLQDLITLALPLSIASDRLRAFPWDCKFELVSLAPADVACVLRRYLGGDLSAAEVEQWANLLEMRDDVGWSDEVGEALNMLANPETQGALSVICAQQLLEQLAA
jgi:hypothetical protein